MPPQLAPGAVLASRYELLARLGSGGMGTVYKAHDRSLDELVAVKVLRSLDPSRVARFRSEVKLAWKVRHVNVCALHDYGEDGDLRYITMELVDGSDLKRLIASGGLLWEDAYDVAVQMGEGLQAIHRAGVIHRDLKPANVMLDRQGVVRLMDFGIARVEAPGAAGETETGEVMGSPDYMSPEQIRGVVDFRTDLYAYGVVLYELFTGRVPFSALTPQLVLLRQLNEAPSFSGPAAARLPAPLVPVLARALAKDPAARYPGCPEMLAAVRAARAALATESTDEVAAPPVPPPPEVAYPPEAALLVPTLVRALAHADPEVRAGAARALGRGRHREAAGPLASASNDPVEQVRLAVAEALGWIQGQGGRDGGAPPAARPQEPT